jgi:DNA-binding NtrC family response regulator/predicted negative regulator of RcsB-dependent stress response
MQYETAARSGERITVVRGPRGVGKSRLMAEFRSQMRLAGAVVLEGRCTPGARALAPLADILRQALAFLEEIGRAADADWGPMAFLLGHDAPQQAATGLTLREQRVGFFEAYCALLRNVSHFKPPVILFHDLQWADPATLELMTHLMDGAAPWTTEPGADHALLGLVVASVREGRQAQSVHQLMEHPKAEVMDLKGFDADAMGEFLQTPAVLRRVLRATGGNPERILNLLESTAVDPQDTLSRQLRELDEGAQQLLAALAVIGRPCEAELAGRVAGLAQLGPALDELVQRQIVVKSVGRDEVHLRLQRHGLEELMYATMTADRRQALHRRAAETFGERQGPATQDAAYHALRAGDHQTAVAKALEAAAVLEETFAFEAATTLLEEARAVASTDDTPALDQRLAELYTHCGTYERALECAHHVLERCPRDPTALMAVGRLHLLAGNYQAAGQALEGCTPGPALSLPPQWAAELTALRAEVFFRQGDFDQALAIPSTDDEANAGPAALALRNTRGKIQLARGDYAGARQTFEHNLALAHHRSLAREQVQALINLGIVELREHAHQAAQNHLERALEFARRLGALRESAIALENLAVLAHFRCDYGRALRHYQAAVAELKRLGNRAMLARAANNLGELYLQLGDRPRAGKLADFARQMAGDRAPESIVAEGLLLQARVALQSGQSGKALPLLHEAVSVFAKQGQKTRRAEAELVLARLDLERGDITAARRRIAALHQSDSLDQTRRGETALVEAEIERSTFGHPLRPVLVAIDCFEQAQNPERIWRAHLQAALLLQEVGDRQGWLRHLGRAQEVEAQVRATVPAAFANGFDADPARQQLRPPPAPPLPKEQNTRAVRPAEPPAERQPPRKLRSAISTATVEASRFPRIVWRGPAMAQVLQLVERVAPTDSLVLVRGESGTGKELIADALHRLSSRSSGPFVKVNCAALVDTLLLSELFGHEKGAFTGALQRRKGRFEAADGGTLFLDEIGDISPTAQVSLLRVLQEQRFERVGGSQSIRTNVRIICATHRDLEAMVNAGTFREDLYFRLKSIQVFVPPLRQRPDDVLALAEHFLARHAEEGQAPAPRLSPEAQRLLSRHPWPGNVRELEHVMRSLSLLADGPEVHPDQLRDLFESAPALRNTTSPTATAPASAAPAGAAPSAAPPTEPARCVYEDVLEGQLSLAELKKRIEQQCIEEALQRTGGNITQAASLLGMKRPRLSQLVKEHGLGRHERRERA